MSVVRRELRAVRHREQRDARRGELGEDLRRQRVAVRARVAERISRADAGTIESVAQALERAVFGTTQRATGGPWKVQLGAFAVDGNAERLWARLSDRSELAGATRVLEPVGRVTKLLAGGYASRTDAQNACNALKRSGQECLVTR
mgnify:CR=1 FL=1